MKTSHKPLFTQFLTFQWYPRWVIADITYFWQRRLYQGVRSKMPWGGRQLSYIFHGVPFRKCWPWFMGDLSFHVGTQSIRFSIPCFLLSLCFQVDFEISLKLENVRHNLFRYVKYRLYHLLSYIWTIVGYDFSKACKSFEINFAKQNNINFGFVFPSLKLPIITFIQRRTKISR